LSRVDQVIEVFPPKCRHCDNRLSRRMSTEGEPRRHQVTELPPIEAHITNINVNVSSAGVRQGDPGELPRKRKAISARS